MGSPGVFIHSGTLGGRLPAFSAVARASLPARPRAMTAPPNKTLPSLRNRRRDAEATFLSMSVGLVILSSARNRCARDNLGEAWSCPGRHLDGNHKARRRLPKIAAPCPLLPVPQGGIGIPKVCTFPFRYGKGRVIPMRPFLDLPRPISGRHRCLASVTSTRAGDRVSANSG